MKTNPFPNADAVVSCSYGIRIHDKKKGDH